MKKIHSFLRVGIVCALSMMLAACSTIDCDDAKQVSGDTVEVTLTKTPSALGDIASGVVSGFGSVLPIPSGSAVVRNTVRRASDRALSAAERAAIEREAAPEAEAFIRANSGTFCDKCPDDKPCKATGSDLKLKLINSDISRPDRNGVVTIKLKFKILAGKVSCGPCEECVTGKVLQQDQKSTSVHSCDSKKQVIVDGEAYDAELVAEILGAELDAELSSEAGTAAH